MPKPTAIERAIKYIKANWRKGKTLKEVAELYRLDAGNLERAFKNREGVTFKQFIDERRKAHVISRLTKKSVFGYEIGAELGFANGRAFYRWVERAFGVSFAELSKRARRRLDSPKQASPQGHKVHKKNGKHKALKISQRIETTQRI